MSPHLAALRHSGPFWMLLASLLFACMGVFVKLGAAQFSTAELVFYRCLVGFLVIGVVVLMRGGSLRSPVLGKQFSRAIAGTGSLMLYFYAIAHLPLATAVTLNYTSPLFLALFTTIWLHERPSRALLAAVALGFVGIVILLQPTFSREQWFAGLIGLASGFGAGFAYLNVRMLGEAGEPEWRTVFYFSLIATVAAGIWMAFDRFSPIHWRNVWILLGMGSCATAAQLAMTRAYRKGRTLAVAGLAYSTVLCSSLFGMLLWGDRLGITSWCAIALIIGSGVLTIRSGR
ncbi:DMT family transporter [Chitinimonas sp. BJB300]|uniref:DMT family transporter n=1 Tax=Chitinimonas sp. BJB300 TaxID=1559339 RepID=UPI0018EAC298|nr:DMT family transporter [Chitinimonas sp. BJB300]